MQAKANSLPQRNMLTAALMSLELHRTYSRPMRPYMHPKDQLARIMFQHLQHHTITSMRLDMVTGMVLFFKDNFLHNFNRLLPSFML